MDKCSEQQSREHGISGALLHGKKVKVVGYPWCRDQPISVSPGSLVQKVLCTKHNSALSVTDDAVIAFRRALWELKRQARQRVYSGIIDAPRLHVVDGHALERWLLKTAINVGIGLTAKKWWPPERWAALAFQRAQFLPPAGLFLIPAGERIALGATYEVKVELLHQEGEAKGALVDIDEMKFALIADGYAIDRTWMRRPTELGDEDSEEKIVFLWS